MSETRDASEKDAAARYSYAVFFWVLAGLAALGLLGSSIRPKPNDVPEELRGVWKTNEPAHADRFMELSVVSVSFGTGNATVSTGFIQKIETSPQGPRTLYTITYTDEGEERNLSFFYEPASRTLRLKNQDRVAWIRE
jgi:hypothetical protein